jgi:hypothetical protein
VHKGGYNDGTVQRNSQDAAKSHEPAADNRYAAHLPEHRQEVLDVNVNEKVSYSLSNI